MSREYYSDIWNVSVDTWNLQLDTHLFTTNEEGH